MLQIADDLLPQSLLTYVAFRVALRETVDRLAAERQGRCDFPPGYLAEVPFLREVAMPVQLDLLAATWDRHMSRHRRAATLLDESVVYAACEFTAALLEREPQVLLQRLRGGPLDLAVPLDHALAADLRHVYLKLSNDGDFLLIGQLLDLPPEDAHDWKQRLGIDVARVEPLFDALGRWHPAPELIGNLHGLVTAAEAQHLSQLLVATCPGAVPQKPKL